MTHIDQSSDKSVRELPVESNWTDTVEAHKQLVANLTKLGIAAIQRDRNLQDQLAQSADQLTSALRWERRYAEAIELQEQLIQYLPDDAASLRVMASTLKIEAGKAEEGLRELQSIAELNPGNIWSWITLGSSYLWTGQYAEAEKYFLRAVELNAAENSDRASAYHFLFKLYGIQKRVDEAVNAWEQSIRLDSALESTVSDLLRVLIYWYHYDTAESYLHRENSELRRKFYRDLISAKRSPSHSRSIWEWVTGHDPKTLEEAHDEFAEACLRFVKPRMALEAIEPLIDRGDVNRRRLALAGLAWAQQRMVDRAKWALDLALRVGDLDRPRGTRRSAGGRRILDTETRILYGEIIVDPDIREELDRYFMPVVDND